MKLESNRFHLFVPDSSHYEAWKRGHLSSPFLQNPFDKPSRSLENLTLWHFEKLLAHLQQESKKERSFVRFVFEKETKRWVGTFTLFDILRGTHQNAWLGYHVFNSFWKQGIASECLPVFMTLAFEKLRLHRVEALVEPENQSSIRVLQKSHFIQEAYLRKRVLQQGKWKDTLMFSLLSEEWKSHYRYFSSD